MACQPLSNPHAEALEFLLSILAITQRDGSHAVLFQRGGDAEFAHVKVIGPGVRNPSDPKNAHLAVLVTTGEVAVADTLSRAPGARPRRGAGAQLGRFEWFVDPVGGESICDLVVRLVDDLKSQSLW